MSEQEHEGSGTPGPEESDVEAHIRARRGDAEAPEDAGERSEDTDEPDVEAHIRAR